jgi:hypothetical protein
MIYDIKALISRPTIQTLVERELYETKLGLHNAQSNLEYATAMVSYYNAKIRRLESTKV